MRTSLEGTQASRERESHPQDANVAEADMVKHSMLKLRTPISIELPTVTNWVGEQSGEIVDLSAPQLGEQITSHQSRGPESPYNRQASSKRSTLRQGF